MNIKYGENNINSILNDKYKVNANDYEINFEEWEFNESVGHDISFEFGRMIVKKFRPNTWIVRSTETLNAEGLCSKFSNLKLYTNNINKYCDSIFSYNFYSNGCVWGDGGTKGRILGIGALPYCMHQYAISAPELPFSAYVWDNCTYNNGSKVQLGSELTALRGDWNGNGYNSYGKVKDFDKYDGGLVFPDLKSFTCPWNEWRFTIGLYTGNVLTFDRWVKSVNAKIENGVKLIISERQDETSSSSVASTQEYFSNFTFRVTGLKEGDRLEWGTGVISESDSSIKTDGDYTLSNLTNNPLGFILYGDVSINSDVTIEIIDKNNLLNDEGLIDISDDPIIISSIAISGIDITTIESWDAYLKDINVYHKERNVENLWAKYGLIEKVKDENGNELNYYQVGDFSNSKIGGGIKLPIPTDWENYMQTEDGSSIIWRTYLKDLSTYDTFREWYKNNTIKLDILNRKPFAYSNFNGEITLRLNEKAGDIENNYMYCIDPFFYSDIEKVNLVSENGCIFSAGQNFFRRASGLTEITFENINKGYIFGATDHSGMFEFCSKIKKYPNKLINWAKRGNPNNTLWNTNIPYMFEYSGFEEIPSWDTTDRYIENNNIIVAPFCAQAFNFCNSLKKIGPILNVVLVNPSNENSVYRFLNSSNIEDIRLKNLNHATWRFDGTGNIGNLPNLNRESVQYIFDNLMDLNTCNPELHEQQIYNSFLSWNSNYKLTESGDTIVRSGYFTTNKRASTVENAEMIVNTTEVFLTPLKFKITGLMDGDVIDFGGTSYDIDGTYEIIKTNNNREGFRVFSSDNTRNTNITLTILSAYDTTNPLNSSAELYCPSEWNGITYSENIGWNINKSYGLLETTKILKHNKRNSPIENGNLSAYNTKTLNNLKFRVSGLTDYDTLCVGESLPLEQQTTKINFNGEYTIAIFNENNTNFGFSLFNETPYTVNENPTFIDSYSLSNSGVETQNENYILSDFIPINESTKISWCNLDKNGNSRICEYSEDKGFLDYWTPSSETRDMTLTGGKLTKFIRFSIKKGMENDVYLIDETNKIYLYKGNNVEEKTWSNTELTPVSIELLSEDYYTNKITDEMIESAKLKGWTTYIGGVKMT